MIADLDETIRQILITEMPIKNGEIEVKFDQPKREWSSRLTRPTVNLFLYDLRENPQLRQHGWQRLPENGNGSNRAHLKRTPLRVDCFYMLTTWATDPEDEHRLLTRSLLALFRHPVLPEELLTESLRGQPYEIQAKLAQHDRLTNPAEVWSALDNEMRPSISYIITLALDPWSEVTGPIVSTLLLRSGHKQGGPLFPALVEGTVTESVGISGVVRTGGDPAAGISVAVKGTGLFASSDARGRFSLGMLPPGEYTLVAWPEKGKPKEKPVVLPPGLKGGDYDIEF